MITPTITVQLDVDTGLWTLYATSYNVTNPAGERLFRAEPWPDVQFTHQTRAAAERDAGKLQAYINSQPERRH